MKVDREKFYAAVAYLREINRADIHSLDLSDFGEPDKFAIDRSEWKFAGLNNTHFITDVYGESDEKKNT